MSASFGASEFIGFLPIMIISSLVHLSMNALYSGFSSVYTLRSPDIPFCNAFGVCNISTALGNVKVILHPPSTFCFIRTLMLILNPVGHSSNNSALDVSCTGGVAPGGWFVGRGVRSHLAPFPGCSSKVADGAASLCFLFSPMKSIFIF